MGKNTFRGIVSLSLFRPVCDSGPLIVIADLCDSGPNPPLGHHVHHAHQAQSKLEAFHTRSQRRILNIKWSDFITNDEVYTRSGLESLHSIVRRRRLGLFGHIARMPADVPATSALRLAVRAREGDLAAFGWHRPRGRPPTTWLHQICSDCELKPSAALECAQDRSIWRAIATADQPGYVRWLIDCLS